MIEMIAMTVSMLIVGWFIWKFVNERESRDEELQAKLDADDRRAAIGRGETPEAYDRELLRDRDRDRDRS